MNILVINCGSSSLKFQLIDSESEKCIAKGLCERIGIEGSMITYAPEGGEKEKTTTPMPDHTEAIRLVLNALTNEKTGVVKSLDEIGAVGHRIVHGGEKFTYSAIINDEVIAAIKECNDLAPLHNPANLIGIDACKTLMPTTPMVAVFDTAFHQTMPEEAYLYGIPYEYYEKYKVRRYGFHGTSHSYVSKRAAEVLGEDYENLKIVVCHLGNGSSVSAVKNGKCVDTSMGLTPLEGLIMGTRSGDIDPAIIEFLANKEGMTAQEVVNVLNKKSGVLGLSAGLSSDFRDLEDGLAKNDENAIRAMKTFCYRVAKYIGSYAAAMNGIDAICFTAGVGENGPIVRNFVCDRLQFLGIELDQELNNKRGQDLVITTPESKTKVLVIPTNEELAIARETAALVK
ncbi:MAG: acetate kinase [Lachnospiraceae bacterium]|nr:acetate kinase [Lachnospiraceae bacterium]